MFKVGDRVKCITVGRSMLLKVGKEYSIKNCYSNGRGDFFVHIEDELGNRVGHSYFANKFKLVDDNMDIINGR